MQAPFSFLAAENLACRRGERLLFRKLSFRLEAGAACHVTGANGAGKTTLLRALAGLTTPYAGAVQRKGALDLVDERTGLDPDLPLGKALAFWAKIDLDSPIMFDAYCERLGLDNLLEVPVRYLSTGQKQRAAIARLLLRPRPIWLLDEPFAGLDTASQGLLAELVGEHCAAGGLCVFVSHQPVDLPARSLDLAEFAA